MRKPFVAGNWKMNTDSHSSVGLAESIVSGSFGTAGERVDVAVCPPFVYLQAVTAVLSASFGATARDWRDGRADK